MATTFNPQEVINGTNGELWLDDVYVRSVQSLEAKVDMAKGDVKVPRDLWVYKKVTELTGTGSITLQKINSLGVKKINEYLVQGKTPVFKILSKLDDPDAAGAERVMLKHVTFNTLNIANWTHGELVEETMDFDFAGYEFYDLI